MKRENTAIEGVWILEPTIHRDARGFFYESYNQQRAYEVGLKATFVQDNISSSKYGVLRGLHYQLAPYAQGKLVRVSKGEVLDVVVDLRKGSPSFGKSISVRLSEDNKVMLWVPEGMAHGFIVLSEMAEFNYKVTNYYSPGSDRTLLWNDPALEIDWIVPHTDIILSEKDKAGKALEEAEINFNFSRE